MEITKVCRIRRVNTVNAETPLIVPSFSSKGFQDLAENYKYYKENTVDASLVSAYDLHHGGIPKDDFSNSEFVIIDSGGYERSIDIELSDIYRKDYIAKEWTSEMHEKLIAELVPLAATIIVSYDRRDTPTEVQIDIAKKFFAQYPQYGSDFLYKPEIGHVLNIGKITQHILSITSFNVLGFTEKELGNSLLVRCRSILNIRRALIENEINTPIHIFGCIDPLNILAYFLCGADIFDGLSWQRFAFDKGVGIYRNSYAITNGMWDQSDQVLNAMASAQNLAGLTSLRTRMIRFTQTYDWSVFELDQKVENELKRLVATLGILI